MQKTTLTPSALPGKNYTFVAKIVSVGVTPTIATIVYGPNPNATLEGS